MSDTRQEKFRRIGENGAFDVVVLGGGINGIGVYRDLALQGLRVLLVERSDFCSGCSAAPSRMIHGGLRYLENGELGLVRESLRERDLLLTNAPHLVHPLPTTIPIGSLFSGLLNGAVGIARLRGRPARRGAVPIKLGLSLYDWVTRKGAALPRHSFRSARETLARWPALTPDIRCSATYHDAWISHPERLGIELLQDTARGNPDAIAVNYATLRQDGRKFHLTDCETGDVFPVTARALVNATGAWLDQTIADLAGPKAERLVSGTKGSHLILDNAELSAALAGHMIYFENTDGRVCIVFPYLGKVLAGATDIRVDHATRVRCEPEERDYILRSLGRIFPGIALSPADVVFSFSGIRPLPKSDHDFTGRISRGHFTRRLDGPVPQFCMVGGKWTTFRAFAEQTADEVLSELGVARRTDTAGLAIGGGAGFPDPEALEARLVRDHGLSASRAAYLTRTYGSKADEVALACRERPDRPLAPGCDTSEAELAWLIAREHVVHLGDLILRRTALAITGQVSTPVIERAADIAGARLGWSPVRRRAEIAQLIDDLETYHGVSPETLKARETEDKDICA